MSEPRRRLPPELNSVPSPEDSWCHVELFRLQYGELPKPDDHRRLDKQASLNRLADLIEEASRSGDYSKLPPMMNMVSILRYCARYIRE